jgi:hypothetical protein
MTPPWTPFLARVRAELEAIASGGDAILEASQIEYQGDSNRGGGGFCAAGAARACRDGTPKRGAPARSPDVPSSAP